MRELRPRGGLGVELFTGATTELPHRVMSTG